MKTPFFLVERLAVRLKKLFPHHQIYFRTDGKVRFFTLTTWMQLTMVFAVASGMAWLGKATYDHVIQSDRLQANRVALNKMSGKMQALSDDYQGLEQRILQRAARIEARQGVLQKLLEDGFIESDTLELDSLMNEALTDETKEQALKSMKKASLQLKRTSAPGPEAHFDALFSFLERRQKAFAQSLEQQADREYSSIVSVLNDLNIDPSHFLDDLESKPAGFAQRFMDANIGGPVVAPEDLEAGTESDDPLVALAATWASLRDLRGKVQSIPAIAPVGKYYISSKYGKRRDPFTKRWSKHSGLDLAAWYGTPVTATGDGKVTYAGYKAGYGRVVEIDHGNGFKSRYGHLRKVVTKKGQIVTLGEKVGETGSTGRSTGPHVHYEIWFDGETVDPARFIKASNDVLKIQGRPTRG